MIIGASIRRPYSLLKFLTSRPVSFGWLVASRELLGALDYHRLRGWRPGPFELEILSLPKEVQFLFYGTNAATLHALDDFVPILLIMRGVLLIISPTQQKPEVASN